MFDKMKQLYDMQKKARELQKKLEELKVEQIEGGIKLVLNGVFKVESLEVEPSFLAADKKEKLEATLKNLFNGAVQEIQKRSAAQSSELLKGLPF